MITAAGSSLAGAGAAFIACLILYAGWETAHTIRRAWRHAGQLIAETRQHPAPANPPGLGTDPVPGHPRPPSEGQFPPVLHAPAPADHGGLLVSIDIFADDRIVTTYHTQDRAEVNTGRCLECAAEAAAHSDWDAALRRLAP